ncbi:hypothetical protein CLPUN_42120 [Clostridium puniceum]|uniref:Uncharacterized protein n=1 Tax=Clostridium puniceum TaxID=29367 RepID=A0A1S8T8M4_9CLOT|nr:DNA-binding response regulator [Clostridium puniceum]OOM73974.1 hypothetical protein CLPUN_42120 [Clostridium puniceum]
MNSKIDKELVKILYIDEGLNSSEIAKKLNLKVKSVEKCIQRNFNKYKLQHKRVRLQKKETEKAINYEATRCMSDGSFIKKNPSIYKTDSNGDIIVNAPEEILTWDVPKKLKNDDSTELYNKRVTKKYRDTSNESLN